MNWQHLIYFQAVAKTGNFGKASEQLYVTTSALSKAISSLEQELGFILFERQGRNSVLTENGRIFLKYVTQANNSIQEGLDIIHAKMNSASGTVRAHGVYSMVADYLPAQIKGFNESYPLVRFVLNYKLTAEILDDVLSGKCDLGFCGNFVADKSAYEDIDSFLLFTEDLCLAVPPGHRLYNAKSVDFGDLGDETFIGWRNADSGINLVFTTLCHKYGITPNVAFEASDDSAVLNLVRANLGISLIPSATSLSLDGLHMIPFSSGTVFRENNMVWSKSRYLPQVAAAFRDYLMASWGNMDAEESGFRTV